MFEKNTFEDRTIAWIQFRQSLENSSEPINDLCRYCNRANLYSITCNPWDRKDWPTAWELVSLNRYCCFTIMLGMCYTLFLTNRFRQQDIRILITKDTQTQQTQYLISIQKIYIGYDPDLTYIDQTKIGTNLIIQKEFAFNH